MRSYLSSTSCSQDMNWRALKRSRTDLFSSPCRESQVHVRVQKREFPGGQEPPPQLGVQVLEPPSAPMSRANRQDTHTPTLLMGPGSCPSPTLSRVEPPCA